MTHFSTGPCLSHSYHFDFFLKIRGDICKLMFISGVNDNAIKEKNFEVYIFFIFC
jgi:hypothetical protein